MYKTLLAIIPTILLLSSCITFPVLSHTEKASTLQSKGVGFSLGNYARNFFLAPRFGIYKDDFVGVDSGVSFYYSLPSSDFSSYSISPDIKISLFQTNQSKFGTGMSLSFLYLRSTQAQIQNLYYIVPTYMESSLTEWFTFILNFRFFIPIIKNTEEQNFLNQNFITINVGANFFNSVTLQVYLLATPLAQNIFPIPGIQLSYEVNF